MTHTAGQHSCSLEACADARQHDDAPSPSDASCAPECAVSTERLLGRIAAGDRDAFIDLYDRFAPRLFGLILTIVHDRHASEDVLQQVLLEVWERHAARYQPVLGAPDSWLLRLARSRAIDRVRAAGRSKSRLSSDNSMHVADDRTGPSSADRERAASLREALCVLPEIERTPLELAFIHGLTREEIADHCGIPVGTVKTRVRRAVARLRGAVDAREENEP